jgi:hypothetical protein
LTPTGTRTCRIPLGSDAFVDSNSVRIMYTINNLDTTKNLQPNGGGPWGCFASV